MVKKSEGDIEKIKDAAIEWCEKCDMNGIGYGIFFFEQENSVTGGANLNIGEIALVLERISKRLSHKEIRLLTELLKKSACDKQTEKS